jgi:hypothetical protein
MQKFSAYNFFGVNFCAFCSADAKSAWHSAIYDTNIEFAQKIVLILALFANFEAKQGKNGFKNEMVFYKCVGSILHSFSVWEVP